MNGLKARTAFKTVMIAPCGINCGVCMAHLREKNHCPGCNIKDNSKPKHCNKCQIKYCSNLKGKYCYQCDNYPCQRIKHLDKRYTLRYKTSIIGNLNNIREKGIKAFVKEEAIKWECPKCGGIICIHNGACFMCESQKLFKR